LGRNHIGDEGAKAIAEALKVNPVLTSLDLRANIIGVDGAKAIAEVLKVNRAARQRVLQGRLLKCLPQVDSSLREHPARRCVPA
jgi:hypothetical protein